MIDLMRLVPTANSRWNTRQYIVQNAALYAFDLKIPIAKVYAVLLAWQGEWPTGGSTDMAWTGSDEKKFFYDEMRSVITDKEVLKIVGDLTRKGVRDENNLSIDVADYDTWNPYASGGWNWMTHQGWARPGATGATKAYLYGEHHPEARVNRFWEALGFRLSKGDTFAHAFLAACYKVKYFRVINHTERQWLFYNAEAANWMASTTDLYWEPTWRRWTLKESDKDGWSVGEYSDSSTARPNIYDFEDLIPASQMKFYKRLKAAYYRYLSARFELGFPGERAGVDWPVPDAEPDTEAPPASSGFDKKWLIAAAVWAGYFVLKK